MTLRLLKTRMATMGAVLTAALAPALLGTTSIAAAAPQQPAAPPAATTAVPPKAPDAVPAQDRDALLPKGWQQSGDVAWTTSGDSTGFHLLMADAKDGYAWRTVASVNEPGIPTDQWVGNACITGSGRRAVLVYAPRHFTNRDHLFERGGFAAVVDLTTGAVTKLDVGVSLAYYDPGCGTGETAVLTQSAVADLGKTRLHVLDAARGSVVREQELTGQVTSAVPLGDEIVAASGPKLVGIAADGRQRTLATTRGVPFDVHPDAAGGITFLDQPDGRTAAVNAFSGGKVRELGRGALTEVGLKPGIGGRTFVTGSVPELTNPPAGMQRLAVDAHAEVSTQGGLAVQRKGAVVTNAQTADQVTPVDLVGEVTATGKAVTFRTAPAQLDTAGATAGATRSPVLREGQPAKTGAGGATTLAAGSATDPTEADRYCAVSRNDLRAQTEQPHWKQVEWAADLAVKGNLTITRKVDYNGSGNTTTWSPQGMYPRVGLTGGGTVPASVMLGILAQESNLWQASWHVLEGEFGNPLVGAYYGIRDGWAINWANADCGYGVAQVTDGMRLAGHPKPGEVLRPANEQKAIAVDYATNIAAGLRILESKWNQVYPIVKINNADPAKIENWFAAAWAYNSGLNPQAITGNTTGCSPGPSCTDDRGNWGLGWGNNPANPDFNPTRRPFLNGVNGEGSQADAAHPNLWPYPEKVMGWAAFPIVKYDFRTPDTYYAAYLQAWWTDNIYRTGVKPPITTFCSTATATNNHCTVTNGTGACQYSDYHCWWHWNATWKPNCQTTDTQGNVVYTCGYDNIRYAAGSAEPPDGTQYPPVCSRGSLPGNALIVDDQPDSVAPVRQPCGTPTTNSGQFSLQFAGSGGLYPSKLDFHQIGGGLDGHFWFGHTFTQPLADANKSQVTGTWTLTDRWWGNQWARVFVHIPDHASHTQQADYVVDTGSGTTAADRYRHRVVNTKTWYDDANHTGDRWVPLGVFNFTGVPAVSLSNITRDGNGTQDVVWDAVAFQQLPAKPKNFVVALGDSYSSGEGASEDQAVDYYRETNRDGTDDSNRNACHRSRWAWIRKTVLADNLSALLGSRADSLDDNLDLQLIACSGAETENLLSATGPANAWGQRGESTSTGKEIAQLDSGFLDENTTLVTLSIGGNDTRFGPVFQFCTQNDVAQDCQNQKMGQDADILSVAVPNMINNQVKPSIATTIEQIHAKAKNAKIVLVGYPKLIDNIGCLQGPTAPSSFRIYISSAEAAWMNQTADVLATAMAEAVAPYSAYAKFADPRGDFAGAGACSVSDESIHGIVFGQTPGEKPVVPPLFIAWGPSQQSFHPKIKGTTKYATTVNRALRSMGL